jgi:hypothetical protein
MPHRYSSERRINKAKTKKRKSRKQKKVRSSRKMRKSRKNKYYSQNQEGGWSPFSGFPFSRLPFSSSRKIGSVHPHTRSETSVSHTPSVTPITSSTYRPYQYSELEHTQSLTQNIIYSDEELKQILKKKRKQDIIDTIEQIKFHRKIIRPLLLTEDNHFQEQLQADELYKSYQYYTGSDYPQIDFAIKKEHNGKELTPQEHLDLLNKEFDMDYAINKEYNGEIINDQRYLELLDTELQNTLQYRILLQNFARENRIRQQFEGVYKESISIYTDSILYYRHKISSVRREIQILLQLLKANKPLKDENFGLFQQYMLNYAGLLPITLSNTFEYKEFEHRDLAQELISTQTDLEKLKRLIDSFNTATAT